MSTTGQAGFSGGMNGAVSVGKAERYQGAFDLSCKASLRDPRLFCRAARLVNGAALNAALWVAAAQDRKLVLDKAIEALGAMISGLKAA